MHSLRERSERDMNTFNSELKDLLRIIDHDKKLREFMQTKMEERTEIYETAVKDRREKKLLNYVKGLQVELEHYENIFNELQEVSSVLGFKNLFKKPFSNQNKRGMGEYIFKWFCFGSKVDYL